MKLLPCFACAFALALFHASAATATFQPVADTTIDDMGGLVDLAGSMVTGKLGLSADFTTCRSLVRFDLASIPTNAVVESVTVQFTVIKYGNFDGQQVPNVHTLNPITAPWNENATWGNSGVVGWNGGSFDPDEDASTTFGSASSGTYTFSSGPMLVNRVQNWVQSPASNQGWILRNSDEDSTYNGRRIGTRENAIASTRPVLTVNYSLPTPSAPAITLQNFRIETNHIVFTFAAQSGSNYTAQYKSVLQPGPWTTLRSFPAAQGSRVLTVTDALTTSNRFYRVVSP